MCRAVFPATSARWSLKDSPGTLAPPYQLRVWHTCTTLAPCRPRCHTNASACTHADSESTCAPTLARLHAYAPRNRTSARARRASAHAHPLVVLRTISEKIADNMLPINLCLLVDISPTKIRRKSFITLFINKPNLQARPGMVSGARASFTETFAVDFFFSHLAFLFRKQGPSRRRRPPVILLQQGFQSACRP